MPLVTMWQGPTRVTLMKHAEDLLGTPARMPLTYFEDRADHMSGRGSRAIAWPARKLLESCGAALNVAVDPLVGRRASDAVLGAQFAHRSGATQVIGNKESSLVHR